MGCYFCSRIQGCRKFKQRSLIKGRMTNILLQSPWIEAPSIWCLPLVDPQELCGQQNLEFANVCFLVSNAEANERFTPRALVYYRIKFGLLATSRSQSCSILKRNIIFARYNPGKSLHCNL